MFNGLQLLNNLEKAGIAITESYRSFDGLAYIVGNRDNYFLAILHKPFSPFGKSYISELLPNQELRDIAKKFNVLIS